jgi:hypothetical protein
LKKFVVTGNDKLTYYSSQLLMLITNMVVLFSKILVLMKKIEKYGQNSYYLALSLVKRIFLNTRKKRKKSIRSFVTGGMMDRMR